MKSLFVIFGIFTFSISFGQKAKLEKDTIYYGNNKYWVGKEVQLLYGSDPKKNFLFVFQGSGLGGVSPLGSSYGKGTVKIDKVYKTQGTVYARGPMQDAAGKVFIDITGAIDNKEIKEDL